MATELVPGARTWSMTRDSEGHREYRITHLVRGAITDGPANALRTPGLPIIGDSWVVDGDTDLWAWCRPEATVRPVLTNEPNSHFEVEQVFSTRPVKRCNEAEIENPLLEPQKISGSFIKYVEEASYDRFDMPVTTSSFELFRGPQAEFDCNRPTVHIEQNVPILNLPLIVQMINTVNIDTLWGMPRRCIKLTNSSWEQKFYGLCSLYYTRIFDFEVAFGTFDRLLLDESNKVLIGKWEGDEWAIGTIDGGPPSRFNPGHFIQYEDKQGNHTKVILNGLGVPANTIIDEESGTADSGSPGRILFERYRESNFLLLGIPVVF